MRRDRPKKCECCGRRVRKNATLCQRCAHDELEAASERYHVRAACTFTEYVADVKRIEAMQGIRSKDHENRR